jgi:hypothetical protein
MSTLPPYGDKYYSGLPNIEYKKDNVGYTVKYFPTLEVYTCSCKDFNHRRRFKNEMCKHIMSINDIDDSLGENTSLDAKIQFFESKMVTMVDNTKKCSAASTSTSTRIITPDKLSVSKSATHNDKSCLSVEEACQMVKDLVHVSKNVLTTVDGLVDKLQRVKVE